VILNASHFIQRSHKEDHLWKSFILLLGGSHIYTLIICVNKFGPFICDFVCCDTRYEGYTEGAIS
jgi:hypothetical protein